MVLSIYSPNWDAHDSYGIIARKIAEHLDGECNRLGLTDADGTTLRPSPGGLVLGYPTLIKVYSPMVQLGKRLAITMFESTILPDGWVDALNCMDGVVVPASFMEQVFRDNGVEIPIHVVPLGVDDAYKQVKRLPRVDRPYTFLAIGDRGMRKGWDLAWHGFRTAFGDRDDVRLIIKAREGGLPHISSADANVEILRADLSLQEMAALYARCDCMVFPTRGEGFGLPPREFACTGGVAIATRWGGTRDDILSWGIGIPYKLTPAWVHHSEFDGVCGQWAEPDLDALVRSMQMVVASERLFAHTARIKAQIARMMYDWTCFAQRVLEIYYDD